MIELLEPNRVVVGDWIEVMAGWPENSVDLIVTDPPYGIQFMGLDFDKVLPPREAFEQMIRVLKPGALAFVMSSPRQDVLWRMLALLEGVGFELRQSFISWVYKTGFPKAYDVSKGIDRKLGLQRETIGIGTAGVAVGLDNRNFEQGKRNKRYDAKAVFPLTEPASELAKQWEGWKSQTGLKPALECILMVNKPRSEPTIVDNVLRWGTGAMNVDAARIPFQNENDRTFQARDNKYRTNDPFFTDKGRGIYENKDWEGNNKGRFPANLLVSDGAIDNEYEKVTDNREMKIGRSQNLGRFGIYGQSGVVDGATYGDSGYASRYFDLDAWAGHHGFLDVAKPSRAERDFGLLGFKEKELYRAGHGNQEMDDVTQRFRRQARNAHPTVKPVKLMAYLIKLGCPPKGIVVDPFLGSGTTCIAAKRLRRQWIGIEINPEYAAIAEARINIRGPLDQFI